MRVPSGSGWPGPGTGSQFARCHFQVIFLGVRVLHHACSAVVWKHGLSSTLLGDRGCARSSVDTPGHDGQGSQTWRTGED